VSPASSAAAQRLWATEGLDPASPEAVVATIEHVSARLRIGLGRWIGFEGYRVLLERVVEEAVTEDPTLRGLRWLPGGVNRLAEMVPADEVPAVSRGFVSVVALLIHRLSQVIGEDMSMRLVEQAWTASSSDGSTDEMRGETGVQEVRFH
jgi:hypothetical protein